MRGFASDWKRSIENINQEIMRSFSNFKNGTAILQVRWFLSTQFPGSLLFPFFLYTSELTQQNGKKKRTAKRLCVTNVTGLLLACRWFFEILYLIFLCSGLIQKYLFRRGWRLAGKCSKRNYCHVCHTRFVVSFPLRSYCVSSQLLWGTERRYTYESVCFPHFSFLFYFISYSTGCSDTTDSILPQISENPFSTSIQAPTHS